MEASIKNIIAAYQLLNSAKLDNVSDPDKLSLIKTLRKMKKVIAEYNSLREDVIEKLKDDKFDEMNAKAQQWQQEGSGTTLTETERKEVNLYFIEYNQRVEKCISAEIDKPCDIGTPIKEETFLALMGGNKWTLGEIDLIDEVLVGGE